MGILAQLVVEDQAGFQDTETIVGMAFVGAVLALVLWLVNRK